MKPRQVNTFILILILFAQSMHCVGQIVKTQGAPRIHNYKRFQYGGAHQIWDIAQDANGLIYLASFTHLSEYDGYKWRNYKLSSRSNLRCLHIHQQRIYSGGLGAAGYWERNAKGDLYYTPLIDQTNAKSENIDEFWKIHHVDKKVYFQSFYQVVIFEDGKKTSIPAPSKFHFSFQIGKRIFVQDLDFGLYEIIDGKLNLVLAKEKLADHEIWGMFRHPNKGIVVATYTGELFMLKKNELELWQTEADTFLKNNRIFTVKLLDKGNLAIGTILGGLIILNQHGQVIQQINQSKGMNNNTVLSLLYDANKNLWLGLDNGMAFLETNAPYTYFSDTKGTIGAVYATLSHQGKLYVGTNQGLISTQQAQLFQPLSKAKFSLHKKTQGQVWTLARHQGQVLCGHDKGIFHIGKTVKKISKEKGAWLFVPWPSNKSILLCGTYTGIAILKTDASGQVRFHGKLPGFVESSRFLAVDEYENIWVSHPLKGLYRLRINSTFDDITEKEYYGGKTAIGTVLDTYVLRFEDKVVFSSPNGFFRYNVIKNSFIPHEKLNHLLGKTVVQKTLKHGMRTWYVSREHVGYLQRKGNNYSVVSDPFGDLSNNYIPNFGNMFQLNDSVFSLASYGGLTLLHTKEKVSKQQLLAPNIRTLKAISAKDTLFLSPNAQPLKLPYENNAIQFEFSMPNYGLKKPRIYYELGDGIEKEAEGQPISLSNLEAGNYTLRVKLRYHNATTTSAPIRFTVKQAWFKTPVALGLLFLGVLLIALSIWRIYEARFKLQQKIMQAQKDDELQRQQEDFEHKSLQNQQEIMRLENEKLETELRFKSKEMANILLNNIDKNEVLTKIKKEFERVQEESSQKLPKKHYNQLLGIINHHIAREDDWQAFEMNFNEAYRGFFKKLKTIHPNLTPNDLRLCAYLRMNLTSKDIAPLLNISVRSVEVSRYRLRKKLEIAHDKNLVEYILEIS